MLAAPRRLASPLHGGQQAGAARGATGLARCLQHLGRNGRAGIGARRQARGRGGSGAGRLGGLPGALACSSCCSAALARSLSRQLILSVDLRTLRHVKMSIVYCRLMGFGRQPILLLALG